MMKMTEEFRTKIIKIVLGLGLAVICCLSGYQFLRYSVYSSIDLSKNTIYEAEDYEWSLDTLTEKVDIYQVAGWIVKKGEEIVSHNIQLIIVNEDGSSYLVPTEMVTRTDVTKTLNEKSRENDVNYDASGFSAEINKRYVQSPQSKLYLLYQNNGCYEIVDLNKDFAG